MAEYSGRDKRLAYLFDALENMQVDDMTGASASTDGTHGLVPAPLAGDEDKYLKGDGTWAAVQAGAGSLSGLSDVDLSSPTDGQGLVYDGANSKWVNGNVSGGGEGGNVYSNIDFTNLLHSYIGTDANVSYTATRDCYAFITLTTRSDSTYSEIKVNNERVYYFYSEKQAAEGISVPLAKGDVLTITNTFTYWNTFLYVYGLKLIELPQTALIYSTEEREVGVWTDGKPLYQKTYHATAGAVDTYNTLDLGISTASISMVEITDCYAVNGGFVVSLNCYKNSINDEELCGFIYKAIGGNIRFNYRIGSSVAGGDLSINIRYTKTTDTAGSGTWTTAGEYAHHYSTSEKVVGTWVDGKPLYEVTLTNPSPTGTTVGNYTAYKIDELSVNADITLLFDGAAMGSDGRMYALPYNRLYSSNNVIEPEVYADNGIIKAWVTVPNIMNLTISSAWVTIRYTKTTD